jgi:GDPmannose 4,6-dehydratase
MDQGKAIVFGINGQDGAFLAKLCKYRGVDVVGIARNVPAVEADDVSKYEFVESLILKCSPDYVFHLAALSTTRHKALFENHAAISTGTLNILEAVKRHCPDCRVFITGSGVQFKNIGNPISEKDPFAATSAYAVARIQSAYAARYYRQLGIKAYVGYLFHHESPLRNSSHLCQMIAEAVKRIKQGSQERIKLGDISVRKEAAFAGDIVDGIFTLVNQDDVFEATIGTGVAYSIQDWLEVCFTKIGKDWRDFVDVASDGFKPEYHTLVSDPTTIRSLGWTPKVGFDALAEMMLS